MQAKKIQAKDIIKILIAIIFSSCTTISAQPRNEIERNGVNIISINNTNTNTNIEKIKKQNLEKFIPKPSDLTVENKKEVSIKTTLTLESIQALLQEQDFFKKNYKPIIITSAILASYGTCFYAIYYCKSYLEDQNLWSNWQSEASIEKLMLTPQNQLASEVYFEIQSKYENKNNFILSLSQFMKDIEKEKNTLILYDKVYNFLNKYYVFKFFPINTGCFENISEKIERLAYIKNIFLSSAYMSYEDKTYIGKKKAR